MVECLQVDKKTKSEKISFFRNLRTAEKRTIKIQATPRFYLHGSEF